MGANNLYFPQLREVPSYNSGNFIVVNDIKTGLPDKLSIANFFALALSTGLIPPTDLSGYLPLIGGTMSGSINMDTNTIILSDISGDIQSISAIGGDIVIGSSAFQLDVTTDAGMIVRNGINSVLRIALEEGSGGIHFGEGDVGILNSSSLTDPRDWFLPDASGTIALTTQLGQSTLAEVLINGNTSGGSSINLTIGDTIRSTANADVKAVDWNNGDFLGRSASNGLTLWADAGDISLHGDTFVNLLAGSGEIRLSSDGGTTTGRFDFTPITANRTWTLQDGTGTLAFLTDINQDIEIHHTRSIGNTGADPAVNSTDHVVFYQTIGAGGSLGLPTPTAGRELIFIRTSGVHAANLAGTVNGGATYALPTALYSRTICIADGSTWYAQ